MDRRIQWVEDSRLWLVLDMAAAAPRTLPEVAGLAAAGGIDAVLCRIKDQPLELVAREAAAVRDVCSKLGIRFVMSHFPELAVDLRADAVQVGITDPPVGEIRRIVGDEMLIGYSTHGVGEAQAQFDLGVDYVFLGPIFETPAKLKYGAPLGLGRVEQATVLPGPVVFIGGIKPDNAGAIIARGGRRIAVIGAIQHSDDPAAATKRLRELMPD